MSDQDPTQMVPPVDGPSSAPPPGPPPGGGPPSPGPPDGPDGPDGPEEPGGPDRRRVAVYVMVGLIVLALLILLIVVLAGGDDDVETDGSRATTSTTTTEPPSTSTSTSSTSSTTTTTTVTTTSTSTSTTTTSTPTTTTTAPPTTIDPARCDGNAPADDPEPVAQVFYDAWTVDDVDCAREVASKDAIDTLFAIDGSDADWTSQGCEPVEGAGPAQAECEFRYEGGSAFFEMVFGPIGGWSVDAVRFVAD